MITLSEAYRMVKPHIPNDFKIVACHEYEDYYAFPDRWRDGRRDYRAGDGPLGVRKSTGTLCHIGFYTVNLRDASWDFTTGDMISDDIGEPLKEYSEEELQALV